jgi:hypothetical protein
MRRLADPASSVTKQKPYPASEDAYKESASAASDRAARRPQGSARAASSPRAGRGALGGRGKRRSAATGLVATEYQGRKLAQAASRSRTSCSSGGVRDDERPPLQLLSPENDTRRARRATSVSRWRRRRLAASDARLLEGARQAPRGASLKPRPAGSSSARPGRWWSGCRRTRPRHRLRSAAHPVGSLPRRRIRGEHGRLAEKVAR